MNDGLGEVGCAKKGGRILIFERDVICFEPNPRPITRELCFTNIIDRVQRVAERLEKEALRLRTRDAYVR